VARVRLRPGTGTITINARAFDNYFTSATHRQMVMEPLRLIDAQQTYDIDATIEGGGVAGQAGALRLGISRSLLELDEAVRPVLKKARLLTRDSRKKETKKYGLKKARKAPQYSKR
jgi:small subunit ribosomal protein S9